MKNTREKLQSLKESLWIFSALAVLIESDALELIYENSSLATIQRVTQLPLPVLEQTINLLVENDFLVLENKQVSFSTDMQANVQNVGFEKFAAEWRVAFGLTSEFIKSSREKTVRQGWHYTDKSILQSQGIHSEYIVTECIPQDVQLQNILKNPGATFLDVGAGVGKISIKLCQLYSFLKVVALEPADMPFQLATANIAESKFNARIELRKITIESLNDNQKFDVAWFPHAFFSDEIFHVGLKRVWDALKPGGMILTNGLFSEKMNSSTYVRQLINSLYGGLRSLSAVTNALSAAGFINIKVFPEIAGYHTITAAKS